MKKNVNSFSALEIFQINIFYTLKQKDKVGLTRFKWNKNIIQDKLVNITGLKLCDDRKTKIYFLNYIKISSGNTTNSFLTTISRIKKKMKI